MKNIIVSKDGVGECCITSTSEISPANEFLIKSMASIQLVCLARNSDTDPKLKELIQILNTSMDRIHNLYHESVEGSDEPNPFTDYES